MPGDSLYWSPTEGDSDDSIQAKEQYIDPWDLENYAYIREHLESMELSSTPSTPSGGGSSGEFAEANSHSFYYVPGDRRDRPYRPQPPPTKAGAAAGARRYAAAAVVGDERRGGVGAGGYDSLMSDQENYAAIDELRSIDRRRRSDNTNMYNSRLQHQQHHGDDRRRLMEEYESEVEEINPYTTEGPVRENPVFGIYDEKGIFRRVALPINYPPKKHQRDRSRSFAYGEFEYEPDYEQRNRRHFGNRQQEIYGRLEDYRHVEDAAMMQHQLLPPIIYDDVVARGNGRKPDNFGLSKYGHLKIDYSCSWNNLNKYIKYN